MRNLVALLETKLVEGGAFRTTRPAVAGDGVSVMSWRFNGEFSSALAGVFLDADQAVTLSSPAGGADGVEAWGYRLGQWWKFGILNNGADIVIVGNLLGFAQQLDVIGIFEEIAIVGSQSVGGAVVAAKLAPIEMWSTP